MCMDFKYLSSIIIDISFSGEELRIGSIFQEPQRARLIFYRCFYSYLHPSQKILEAIGKATAFSVLHLMPVPLPRGHPEKLGLRGCH